MRKGQKKKLNLFNAPLGEAYIFVEKRPPGGVFTESWFCVSYGCHGCWHSCGGRNQVDTGKVDDEIKERVERIKTCDQRAYMDGRERQHKVPKITVVDERIQQLELGGFFL